MSVTKQKMKSENIVLPIKRLCSALRHDEKKKQHRGPVNENDRELNKSVSVQGMPPCMTLQLEMSGRGLARGSEEKEEGASRWTARRGRRTKQDEAINKLLLFRLPEHRESPLSLCLSTGLTLASV